MGWIEVADRVFCRRYQPWDVTVGVVIGSAGVLVIDTRASEAEAAELLDDLRQLDRRPTRWIVNTHSHFDHVNGNERLRPAQVWGHRSLGGTVPTTIDHPIDDVAILHLGDRVVELHHLGLGHTAGDVVVLLPDAPVLFAGDLVEESGPPAYGDDSFPFAWPETNGRLLDLLDDDHRVVPGHGQVVDKLSVATQREQLHTVAQTIRDLWQAGVPEPAALAEGAERWPFPESALTDAVSRGYAQLEDAERQRQAR